MNPNDAYSTLDEKQQELLRRKLASTETDGVIQNTVNNQTQIITPGPLQPTYNEVPSQKSNDDIKRQIADLEKELGEVSRGDIAEEHLTFRDSMGSETFYVKNVSGRHIVVSDLEMNKIPVGKCIDLLKFAKLEDLKNSRDLRTLLLGEEKHLQRLTEKQYAEEKRREVAEKKKLSIVRQQEDLSNRQRQQTQDLNLMPHERIITSQVSSKSVRPAIIAKIGKLALRNDPNPENSRQAITPLEFISWINSEPLTHAEIENIMGDPAVVNDHNIRSALLEKKRSTPSE